MDNLTHSLVGALIGQTGLKRRTGLAMPALIFGANLPDIDAGCVVHGLESLAMRRGLTHGPIAWVVLPLLLAAFIWWFDRWQAKRGTRPESRLPVRFGWLWLLATLACLSHPALDWLNSYGIRLFEPFSQRWFYGDALFIVDVWLWATLGLTLAWSLWREKRDVATWRRPALAGLAAALAYINFNLVLTESARAATPQSQAIAVPVPIRFWERDLIVDVDGAVYMGKGLQRWSLDGGLARDVELLTQRPACLHPMQLPQFAPDNADLAAFLFWSRSPYIDRIERDGKIIDLLKDARFSGRASGQFSIAIPVPTEAETCYFE
ncbi:metal-dependent hydrolase [Croceicoccus ponticola]|uniref:Metal-dependent hydrolase n=1 Tax=Croceicoccus ponticola TaxID=2217664 RepID=A0A437H1C3_9SPHN|nr:metal-dependent hydrolase [Croceicoccus ponticola]RVQ69457.1 metal-dependent hydrolase [Croceicoccus ponticola]